MIDVSRKNFEKRYQTQINLHNFLRCNSDRDLFIVKSKYFIK